jgi:hypothetical protein
MEAKRMKNLVLITRENNEKVISVAVKFCNDYIEAKSFSRFIKSLSLESGDKLNAREIVINREYSLGKYKPFTFDDIITIDNRMLQRVMREIDLSSLAIALKDAGEEVKEHFFKNMSERASGLLKEDIENMDPVIESDIEDARELILDTYHDKFGG